MDHWAYCKYVFRHKWFVFLECCRLGIPWLGIIHDMSKFYPSEWFPYMRHFFNRDGSDKPKTRDKTGYYKPTDTGDAAFDDAWFLHQKRNRHHWQWWILPEDTVGARALPMPEKYLREMLADWRGAGRAQGTPSTLAWYQVNGQKLQLHPRNREWIERKLMKVERWTIWQYWIVWFVWRLWVRFRYWRTGECGLACGYTEPYGFVPEGECPIHDVYLKENDNR